MHRAEEILVAGADFLSERVVRKGWKVFKHRRETLDHSQDELPAYSFDYGEDSPATDQPLKAINSVLSVVITSVAVGPTEGDVRAKLLEMREETDALMDEHMHDTTPRFGLSFVYGMGYGGASAPEISADGETFVGSLSCTWSIAYRLR